MIEDPKVGDIFYRRVVWGTEDIDFMSPWPVTMDELAEEIYQYGGEFNPNQHVQIFSCQVITVSTDWLVSRAKELAEHFQNTFSGQRRESILPENKQPLSDSDYLDLVIWVKKQMQGFTEMVPRFPEYFSGLEMKARILKAHPDAEEMFSCETLP